MLVITVTNKFNRCQKLDYYTQSNTYAILPNRASALDRCTAGFAAAIVAAASRYTAMIPAGELRVERLERGRRKQSNGSASAYIRAQHTHTVRFRRPRLRVSLRQCLLADWPLRLSTNSTTSLTSHVTHSSHYSTYVGCIFFFLFN